MICSEAEEYINAYLGGILSKDGKGEFEGHVATCSRCAEKLRQAEDLLNETGSALKWAMPSAGLADRVAQHVSAAGLIPEKTWSDIMHEQWERAPWRRHAHC